MSNTFTLESLREEADRVFKPLTVPLSDGTESVLRNILRLNEKARTSVLAAMEAINADETTVPQMIDHVSSIIKAVATNPAKLLKDLDGDLAVSIKLIEKWTEGTQLPEAESSPDS
jgi:hypothetical protein